ncbi:MAG: MFS transporter [Terriglobales bacterium]
MTPSSPQITVTAPRGSVRYLYLPAAVAAIGGLLFGFDTAVINGAIVFLKRQFALTDSQTEFGASSLLLGCVFGASLAALTSDRFGRKKLLLAAAALFTLSSIATALPRNITEFVIARVVGGIAIGLASTLSPLYIAEISPARSRGLLVSVNQLAIVTGILLSYGVNYALAGAGPANWRWMFASAAVPSAFFLLALLFVSESPRWLVQNGREAEAEQVLSRIEGADFAHTEIRAIRAAVAEESGNVLDRAFRKPLMMGAFAGMAISLTGVAAAIHVQAPALVVLCLILTYVACFAIGIGTGTWVLMSEICPTRIRGRAMSIATVCLWCGTLLVTLTFLSLVQVLTAPGAFLLYAVICIAALIFVKLAVPETKGRSLEEIEKWWMAVGAETPR